MAKTEVLIVGAGPTGLMAACQLALRKIPFRIIDKTGDHQRQSRALVVHARSMEILQQMGIAEEAIKHGKIAHALNMFADGKQALHFNLTGIGNDLTDFPFLLILEQWKTENILNDFLKQFNIQIEKNTELVEFSQGENEITAILKKNSGEKETINVSWMIGADGAHSIVRETLKIPFLGKTYEKSLFVLDCRLNKAFGNDEMTFAVSSKTIAGVFPMTNGRFRVIGLVPKEAENKETLTFEDVSKNFSEKTHLGIELQNPEWISKYHSHHRVVRNFRSNRCFLAGDSAHIHSPIGGQGMNTGLQDAYNLAWKLSLVIQKKAEEKILDTYHEERIDIAKRIVKSTDKIFSIVSSDKYFWKIYLSKVFPFLIRTLLFFAQKFPSLKRKAFTGLSNIGINYRNSILSMKDDQGSFTETELKPGDRVPHNPLRRKMTDGISFHLLLFSKSKISDELINNFRDNFSSFTELIKTDVILFNPETEKIYEQFGIMNEGYYLVRPDSYIALRSEKLELNKIREYFKLTK